MSLVLSEDHNQKPAGATAFILQKPRQPEAVPQGVPMGGRRLRDHMAPPGIAHSPFILCSKKDPSLQTQTFRPAKNIIYRHKQDNDK